MGCGQSKIHLYPRKNKSKSNGKKSGHIEDADADEEDGHNGRDERDREINGEKEKLDEDGSLRDDGSPEPPNGEIVSILRKNGSLLQSQEISSSQQNFFRMLDQKIEEGPDYDSSSETEQALEEARMNALVQHWESASLTTSMCSSTSRSLQGTPVRQVPLRQPPLRPAFQQPLSAELLSQQQLLKQQHQLILQHHQQQQQQHQQQQQQQQQLQLMTSQQQQQQQQQIIHQNFNINMNINSPKRVVGAGNAVSVGGIPVSIDGRQLLSQTIIHQNYGVIQPSQTAPQLRPSSGRTLPTPVQCLQLSYYQQQQQQQLQAHQQQQIQQQQSQQMALASGGSGAATIGPIQPFQQQQQSLPPPHSYYNDILRHPLQLSTGQLQSQQQQSSASISSVSSALAAGGGPSSSLSSVVAVGSSGSLLSSGPSLQQQQQQQTPPSDAPRFPPAISVQRLAPQVQRQIRETQELIKDSCSQLYTSGYGSPGPPPMAPLRTSASATASAVAAARAAAAAAAAASVNRRATAGPSTTATTLETQYSQELS
ncbi:transcription factor SPT20 homolog isoform X2 [Aedes albopictus]|uniref:Uncharacterized protein n=1 Tax=Aedes albopictus TaxID=7160 RepID=A0ABM1XSB4_AEDAL|nr:transcription factor SPT20 homolog isoform X2 [Aedes albopictus]XP_029733582.1 transcription factor SPT20 homolog isoform X2 [Aedes albopictus]